MSETTLEPMYVAFSVCDIDKTLAISDGKYYESDDEYGEAKAAAEPHKLLDLIKRIVFTYDNLESPRGISLILTGRREKFKDITTKWLQEKYIKAVALSMRKDEVPYEQMIPDKVERFIEFARNSFAACEAFRERAKEAGQPAHEVRPLFIVFDDREDFFDLVKLELDKLEKAHMLLRYLVGNDSLRLL